MKALILNTFNTPYEIAELEKPIAGKGQALVRIMASGVNPLDLKIKAGQAGHAQAKLPAIPGIDMAGIIEAVGEDVTTFQPGDEVYGMTGGVAGLPGSLAEYAAVDVRLLAIKPRNLTMREASALPLSFITAWEGLIDRANAGPGKTVLIHGGAGGVGQIAVQLAKAKNATVFSTVKPAHNQLMQTLGVTPIDYTTLNAEAYVKQYTNGEGFDIVFDTIGGATLDASFQSAKRYTGHVISILGWGSHSLAPLSFRGATYSGVFTLYPLISGEDRKHHGEILKAATELAEAGKLKPILHAEEYTPETIADAYKIIESHKATGKVVVSLPLPG